MTSDVDGSTHLPPMNNLSHSVLKAVLCVMSVTLPIEAPNENLLQSAVQQGATRAPDCSPQPPAGPESRSSTTPSRVVAGNAATSAPVPAAQERPSAAETAKSDDPKLFFGDDRAFGCSGCRPLSAEVVNRPVS